MRCPTCEDRWIEDPDGVAVNDDGTGYTEEPCLNCWEEPE